ncbi:HlyD family secretion protein [Methylocella tundrae]|uniref:Putative HlyD family secretion protein n=1 Tax=Methylocella tundrae TaxID=227605 RepID=A0A4U8YYM0_METTU|nr:HlyD family efflux transporter periplasmic adaptor subunit [Methylocella tundrae]WPP05990.1 HlyD family efflux transporter periplasmic adaptor subunit [Methylocella tundrae]VFU08562.1 putative HlyD family secretion protein [Methylocella tundrae]
MPTEPIETPVSSGQGRPVEIAPAEAPGLPVAAPGAALVPVPTREALPALPGHVTPARHRPSWRVLLGLVVIFAGLAGGGFYWWRQQQARLPVWIVSGNGRIEAEEIDIDTKFAGRLAERLADEGDIVTAGQVVARMDTRDLEATLKATEAQVQQAQRTLEEARANVAQQVTQVTLAQKEIDRTSALVTRGYATHELLDQRRQALDGAAAALTAAQERVGQATHALDAATHNVELNKVNIADNTLVAPTVGRIQYRIANVGEVLPAGGRVFTMLDISDVYMNIYLPTAAAGRLKPGSEARIVLDAWPKFPIPAHVSFVATQAQFTPKAVETEDERDKLMFRVKVRVDRGLLLAHAADVRTGLPGRAYVNLDPKRPWPAVLQGPPSQ